MGASFRRKSDGLASRQRRRRLRGTLLVIGILLVWSCGQVLLSNGAMRGYLRDIGGWDNEPYHNYGAMGDGNSSRSNDDNSNNYDDNNSNSSDDNNEDGDETVDGGEHQDGDDENPKDGRDGFRDDWFDSYAWWNRMRPFDNHRDKDPGIYPYEVCHYFEDVCRIEGVPIWIYDPHKHQAGQTPPRPIVKLHPDRGTDEEYEECHGDPTIWKPSLQQTWNVGYLPRKVASQHYAPPQGGGQTCSYLPVANHFVLTGNFYTKMLGEYMARTYYPMVELVRSLVTPKLPCLDDYEPRFERRHAEPWKQGYLNRQERERREQWKQRASRECRLLAERNGTTVRKMAEDLSSSVTPAMETFRSESRWYLAGTDGIKNKIRESVRALTGLLTDHELLSSVALSNWTALQKLLPPRNDGSSNSSSSCTCLKRLFYCGMKYHTDLNEDDKKIRKRFEGHQEFLDLHNTGEINGAFHPGAMKRFVNEQLERNQTSLEALTRRYLLQTKHSSLALLEEVPDDETYLREWKFVGLSQRSDRRRWLNHGEILEACRERFTNPTHRVVCFGIDLGAPGFRDRPELHVSAHAGLTALIGIFGAHFGETVFMPEGSFALELLPMIDKIDGWGGWARNVDKPTDIGQAILKSTDVHNVGFPLTMSSVMHIPGIAQKRKDCDAKGMVRELDRAKGPNGGRGFQNLDFTAPAEAVLNFIERFVVAVDPKNSTLEHCEDFVRAAGNDYVLYNIHCSRKDDDPSTPKSPHHFFRPKQWINDKTHAFLHQNCSMWDF